jgi:type IV secretion system protein VirB11
MDLAKLIANRSDQSIKESTPLLGATMPDRERIQIAIPPAVAAGTVSITIRKPGVLVKSLEQFVEEGAFAATRLVHSVSMTPDERQRIEQELPEEDRELLELLRNKKFGEFIARAVREKKNIVISGSTGAGKTTLANAVLEYIPEDERIITVEDTPEARLPEGMNVVNMFYSKGGQGKAKVTPKDVFECNLRQRPDRVLPAELRSDETFFFVQNVLNSGHGGTVTTLHSNSSRLAFLRLSMMIKTSPEGRDLDRHDILEMLYQLIDIVIQIRAVKVDGRKTRRVTEIYFDPAFAHRNGW